MTPVDQTPSTVLVVDDEAIDRELLKETLEELGYDVVTAADGSEALEQARARRPGVVLLDLVLPDVCGLGVVTQLKGNPSTATMPIVMISGHGQLQDRVQALELGVDDFLTKPVEKTELAARVKSLLKVKAYNDHMEEYRGRLELDVRSKTAELLRASRRLQDVSLDTVCRLTRVAEYRDDETGAHVRRISEYAALLARAAGLQETTVQTIRYGATMHDLGKVGVPDRILRKPGKLDEDEWRIMRRHPTIGAEILKGCRASYTRMGRIIALTHHERWDGTGYPRGLRGEQIPLVGRIAAIADVFDALTTQRAYKAAFPLQESLDVIKMGRGLMFDPRLVDAFFGVWDEAKAIHQRYANGTAAT
jgi:putative two-component system response regulator